MGKRNCCRKCGLKECNSSCEAIEKGQTNKKEHDQKKNFPTRVRPQEKEKDKGPKF